MENKTKEKYMADNVIRKVFESNIKAFDDKELIIEHFISTEQEDRSKDIVRADGMVLDGIPVVLKQHGFDPDTGNEPIAKPVSIKVSTNDKGVKGILVKTQYFDGSKLTPPDNTGRRLYEKAKGGFMPYWSIGFIGIDVIPKSEGGMEFKKWKLFEYSQVGVPDNIGAEVVKSMSGEELIKQANELLEFGMEKPEINLPEESIENTDLPLFSKSLSDLLKDYTEEELVERLTIKKTNLKSIAERVSRDLPWEAMRILWFGMLDELASSDGSKKAVKIIMEEMNELLMPHAFAFAMAFNSDNQEIQVVKSQIKEGYYNRPAAEIAAPAETPVITPEIKTPADNPIHKAILGLVDAPPKNCVRMSFKKEDVQQLVSEAVKSELQTAIQKMKGKV